MGIEDGGGTWVNKLLVPKPYTSPRQGCSTQPIFLTCLGLRDH